MPSSPTWVRTVGDTAPGLTVQLREDPTYNQRIGDVVDLSNVEAVWWVAERAYDGVRVHEQQAEIIGNPHDGTVYTNLTAVMTEQSGLVRNHVLCFWGDGSMITYPSEPNVDALWLRVRERILVTTAVPVKTAGPTAGVDPVASSIFIVDGGTNTVPSNGAVVFAGANTTINVAPGVTHFTVAEWPTQTPWAAGTTPTIVHAGTTQHGSVTARLLASDGDEVTIARDGLAGAVWFASAPAAGATAYVPPVVSPIFVPDNSSGTILYDGQLAFAGNNSVVTVASGVTNFQLAEWSNATPWVAAPTIVQAGVAVDPTVPTRLLASDGDVVTLGSNGLTWFATAPTAGSAAVVETYEHTQAVASAIWTITHGLGRKPGGVSVFDAAGFPVAPNDVDHPTVNTTVLSFIGPQAGSALLS